MNLFFLLQVIGQVKGKSGIFDLDFIPATSMLDKQNWERKADYLKQRLGNTYFSLFHEE